MVSSYGFRVEKLPYFRLTLERLFKTEEMSDFKFMELDLSRAASLGNGKLCCAFLIFSKALLVPDKNDTPHLCSQRQKQ